MTSLATFYQTLCTQGTLCYDEAQMDAIAKLDHVLSSLTQPETWAERIRGFFKGREAGKKGLYLYGGVGRGKTMVMDMFYEALPGTSKRRVHFHAFMQEVHERLKAAADQEGQRQPIMGVIKETSAATRVLCFDELEIKDIADAMILGRLLEGLFKAGVTIVTTSNRPPEDLYKGGLHWERFQPTIALLKETLEVYCLDSPIDYRTQKTERFQHYFSPLTPETKTALKHVFTELTHNAPLIPLTLEIWERPWHLRTTALGVLLVTFEEACGQPRSVADYLQLAHHFQTILLDNVPQLQKASRDEVRRFILLIDVLYDQQIRFFMRAAVPLDKLYKEGEWNMEFERTLSRLYEMHSW